MAIWLICPESHVWMLLKKMEVEAKDSLVKLRGDVSVAIKELEQLKMSQSKAKISQSMDKDNKKNFAYKCRLEVIL